MAKTTNKHDLNAAAVKSFLESRKMYTSSEYRSYMDCWVDYRFGTLNFEENMEVSIIIGEGEYGDITLKSGKINGDAYPLKFSAKMATYTYKNEKLVINSTRQKKGVIIEIGANAPSLEDD